jgi:methionyl aminopeptidase
VCTSINQEIVHGVPGDRFLQEGDILSIDVGIVFKEFFSDTAITIPIGNVSEEHQRLMDVTNTSLQHGIEHAQPGRRLSDISHAIQTYVESHDYSVVREFVGHGIGRHLHEEPEIPNFGPPGQGPVLEAGMVLAIEPMVNMGGWQTRIKDDGWTVVTQDGKASAHFEHTIAILETGPEVLTKQY